MSSDSSRLVIYGDGACSGNPGPGGWGSIVISRDHVEELGGAESSTTNNRMEISAILNAFSWCLALPSQRQISEILIFTDSVYLIRGITQWIFGWKRRGWKTAEGAEVSNQDLWQEMDQTILALKKKFPEISLKWNFVKGHAGDPGNERCDEIAVAGSKKSYVNLYRGPAKNYIFDTTVLPEPKALPEMNKKPEASASKPAWYISYVNGVFNRHQTWKECEALVKGRAAKFKKVTSEEEETQVKKSWGI
jgi:ribonuclease HI